MPVLHHLAALLAGLSRRLRRKPPEKGPAGDVPSEPPEEPASPAADTPSTQAFLRRRRGVRIPGSSFSPARGSCRSCQMPKGYGR